MCEVTKGDCMELMKILVISLLGITGVIDIKHKKINILLLVPFMIAGIICQVIYHRGSIPSILGGMGIGVVMVAVSMITREKIGSADSLLLIVTGLYLGFFDNLFLFLSASLLSAVFGILLLIIKRVNKNYEIPFIPFLFIAFIGEIMLWS